MDENKGVRRCITPENSSVAGTRPNGVSIQSLLNPISRTDRNMLGSRSADGNHRFSATCEESPQQDIAHGTDKSGCLLKVGGLIGDGTSVENEPQASFRDNTMISDRMTSGDSNFLQDLLSSQHPGVSILNGRLREQSCRKPKTTNRRKRRKYLKRIGVPRYRISSPLQPFSRSINHGEHPIASKVENSQPSNLWRSSAYAYSTSCAFAGPGGLTQLSSSNPSNVNEHPSAPMAMRLPEPSLPTPASRLTFGAVQSPKFCIVTDPSGFTFCTFQPPMHLSADFLVNQYPTTSNMTSTHVHILHRQ